MFSPPVKHCDPLRNLGVYRFGLRPYFNWFEPLYKYNLYLKNKN